MIVDLRSDTVTRPTPGMLEAMMKADVGDDVFGEDPSVKELESRCGQLLGMEGAVYCPSGTMTNQIGINILTQPYDEVICYQGAHIYKHEGGGLAGNSHVSVRLLPGDRGRLSVDEIAGNINSTTDAHYPHTAVVALENTIVREAGSFYTLDKIRAISEFARTKGLKMHLDGARLFNALTETSEEAQAVGQYFDTISICLSKGLGAPVGSVLVCANKALETKARRIRKAFGGGMRQAGFIAAAGLYALDHHIARLREDHARARMLAGVLKTLPMVKSMMPVDSNIIVFELAAGITSDACISKLAEHQVKALKFSPTQVRMVTHLDVDDDKINYAISTLKKIQF